MDTDHPITAGMSADQRFRVVRRPDTFSVAYPPSGPGVQVLARHLLGGDAALMVAEAGAELAHGQPAKARTVFWFGHHDTFHRSTGDAVRLFELGGGLGARSSPLVMALERTSEKAIQPC